MTMKRKKRQLIQDITLVGMSIVSAFYLLESTRVHDFISLFKNFELVGVFFAGMFFTSIFTTAPSIVVLSEFAHTIPIGTLAIVGALGSTLGDWIIFTFVKDRISEDLKYLLSFSRKKRFSTIFETRLFKYFVPFVGALIIASPLPDELGVTLLGLSKINNKVFFLITFTFNAIGIYAIGWLTLNILSI